MGHYAKVVDGIVKQVIVAEAEFFDTFVDTTPGNWIQTSYNTYAGKHILGGKPLRYNFAGVGYTYHADADAFSEPQPYASWTLDTSTYTWKAPISYPSDGKDYEWNESAYQADNTKGWELIE